MEVFTELDALARETRPSAVAIGNFDGVHLGHKRILSTLVRTASRRGLTSILLTFSPHPERTLGKRKVLMIQTLSQRLQDIEASGVEAVLVTPFGARFSSLSPRLFMTEVLEKALRAKAVVVGRDFRFGRGRGGTVVTLKSGGARARPFTVQSVPPLLRDGRVVSSSSIRRLLLRGKVEEAGRLLGMPYQMTGRVVPGRSVGRAIGYPTANIESPNEIKPGGIFLSRLEVGSGSFPSLTYIGTRPTFRQRALQVEAYVLDFDRDIYGRDVRLSLLQRLRPDRTFPDSGALVRQIGRDIARARKAFRLP